MRNPLDGKVKVSYASGRFLCPGNGSFRPELKPSLGEEVDVFRCCR